MDYPLSDGKKPLKEAWRDAVAQAVEAEAKLREAKLRNAKRFLERNETDTPRFLIRGFNSKSGGGADPRLNSPEAVIPHAFLHGEEPTTMWDIENLPEMLDAHLGFDPTTTAFSSWTHSMITAVKFALGGRDPKIAVLNTESLKQHIHHSLDLERAKLCRESFKDEYLIYGPISGPNYHCVSLGRLLFTTKLRYFLDKNAPPGTFGEERISNIERGAVEAAREIAVALQPPGTGPEEILILTAKFVCMRVANLQGGRGLLQFEDILAFLWYMRGDLQDLAARADAEQISLVEPYMDTSFSAELEFEVQLLWATQGVVGMLARAARARISSRLATTHNGQVGDAQPVPSAGTRVKRPRADADEEPTLPNKRRKSGDGTPIVNTRSDEDNDVDKGKGEMDGDMAD